MMIEQPDSNSHTDPEASVQLLGDFLREKRIAKNYTLEKITQKTKINLNILRAIEANDYQHLPSPAYIKGFVTSYSKTLGLDINEVYSKMEYTYFKVVGKSFPALNHTTQFKSQDQSSDQMTGEVKDQQEAPHKVIENSNNVIENTKSLLPIVIFVGVVVAIIGGYQVISTIIKNEVEASKQQDLGPTFEPSSALVKDKVAPAPAQASSVTTDEKKVDSATEQKPVEAEKKDELVEIKQDVIRNFPIVEFRKIRSKLFTVVTDAPENDNEEILPSNIKQMMNSELQNVYIKAIEGSTWLSYKIDEKPIESVIIEKGKDLFLQGAEIRIFLGNVRVTRIFYNNMMISGDTKTGVKSLVFPEASNGKFMLPLFPKAKDDILYTHEEYMKRMKLEEEQLNKKPE